MEIPILINIAQVESVLTLHDASIRNHHFHTSKLGNCLLEQLLHLAPVHDIGGDEDGSRRVWQRGNEGLRRGPSILEVDDDNVGPMSCECLDHVSTNATSGSCDDHRFPIDAFQHRVVKLGRCHLVLKPCSVKYSVGLKSKMSSKDDR